MEALRVAGATGRTAVGGWVRPGAIALAVAVALGLSGCGGGGGGGGSTGNVRPNAPPVTPPPAENLPPAGNPEFSGGEINVDANQITELSGSYGGSIHLTKVGEGTLVLTGNNTYDGGTLINQGTLQVGNGGTTGSIGIGVYNDGVLAFDRSDDITFDGMISGTGTLSQRGTGKLTLTGLNPYTGGTNVEAGTLEVGRLGTLGTGDVVVGVDVAPDRAATLQVDREAKLFNSVWLKGLGILDNAGMVGGIVSIGVRSDPAMADSTPVVLNHDGGVILGSDYAIQIYSPDAIVKNSSGATIEGTRYGMLLGYGGQVENDGAGSMIRSTESAAITTQLMGASIRNTGGAAIAGWEGIDLQAGGGVANSGAGSFISGVPSGIRVAGGSAFVSNTEGARISSQGRTVFLEQGGSVTNGAGSLIETTGFNLDSCAGDGDCAIFVPDSAAGPGVGGALTLTNAGTIVGNVQMDPTADNSVVLFPGGSIHGDLDVGSGHSAMTFNGDPGTVQRYSEAVRGKTTFAGSLLVQGGATWVVDNDDLKPYRITVNGGTLQVGNGGTTGSIPLDSFVTIYHGSLAFDRSDDLTFTGSISGSQTQQYDDALVQAGTGVLTVSLASRNITPSHIEIRSGTLRIDDTGGMPGSDVGSYPLFSDILDNGSLVFDSSLNIFAGSISGRGSVTQNGSAALIMDSQNTYTGGLTVNTGSVMTSHVLPGDVTVNHAGTLDGYGRAPSLGLPGVAGNLTNAGKVVVKGGDASIGGNYSQSSSGTLAVNLGSKLAVGGTAALGGGTLEITGADIGYTSNTHTNVLTATGGRTGTFDRLVKDTGVVFTVTTINYDANSAWLDTTGLDVTSAAAGNGVTYTPVSLRSAQRVQGAFTQLDNKIATADLSGVSNDFVHAAGQFQQAPTLQAAQASLQSLSGQLHAASAAMTFEAIDASTRAMADRFDDLLGKSAGYGMWTQNLNVGGDMGRAGYDGVGFQLNGWLVGSDRLVGSSGVAGFAFGQSEGRQQLDRSYDHNRSRSTEGMFYAGWLNGNWYTQGRIGFGHFRQDVDRQLLLGANAQGVSTNFSGEYNVAYGESGLHLNWAGGRILPFVNVEYAGIERGGFAEQGAGGFGLRSDAQSVSRVRAGLGVRAAHHWDLDGGRSIDFNAGAQFRRTFASQGDVFNASFVGMQQWQPLDGIGLSRYSGVVNVGLDATLSARTSMKFGYDYQKGQRDEAQMLSAHVVMAL